MSTTSSSSSPPTLPRVLGFWIAVAIVIGTVIGSGVFKKPSAVARAIEPFGLAMAAWVLVGVLMLLGALALAEVAVLFPRSGGNYVFLQQAFGPAAGFLWGWVEFWIIRTASIAALATVFTESIHDIIKQIRGLGPDEEVLSYWGRAFMTMSVIAVLAAVNARGTRFGGGLQLLVTTVKVGSLLTIALIPVIIWSIAANPPTMPDTTRLHPWWPAHWSEVDWGKFGIALVGILWAYHGWMNIAPVAGEIRNPNRNLPLALLAGVGTIIVLYLSVNLSYYLVIPSVEMKGISGRTVAGEFFFRILGSMGLVLASAAVMLSVFGSLNGNLLVGPRLLFAMGRDGFAPRALADIHPRYQTPVLATIIFAGWSILLVLGVGLLVQNQMKGSEPFDVLTDYAMFGAVIFETMAVASIFVFRRRYPPDRFYLPYRCRFYPWVPGIYVVVMAAVVANMFLEKPVESLFGLGFILIGAGIYYHFLRGVESPQELAEISRLTESHLKAHQ